MTQDSGTFRAFRAVAGGGPLASAVRLVPALTLAGLLTCMAGCGNSLSAGSSCKDFMNASQSAQIQAIDQIAPKEDAPDATTPLGMPNVSYLCAGDPSQTLGWAIRQTH
ncbi:MAG TPA: hypothetical protein VGG25_06425 [Streptosporangiaceae bacterium]